MGLGTKDFKRFIIPIVFDNFRDKFNKYGVQSNFSLIRSRKKLKFSTLSRDTPSIFK